MDKRVVEWFSRPPRGGRGLKCDLADDMYLVNKSPPSRGAWIEMSLGEVVTAVIGCRPPRGGRGLKFGIFVMGVVLSAVAPLAGGVD